MKKRQLFFDLLLVLAAIALAVFCYHWGKAYDVLIANSTVTSEGKDYESMEAVQVRVLPSGKKVRLYYDDALLYEGQIVGPKTHQLEIIPLDLNDKPIKEQARVIDFKPRDIPLVTKRGITNRVIYVPLAYGSGSVKKVD